MIDYLIIINIIGLLICYIDKKKSINHRYRIPELFLIYISLIGGTFGFSLGMILFHHKTKKLKFEILEPIFIILWIIFFIKIK